MKYKSFKQLPKIKNKDKSVQSQTRDETGPEKDTESEADIFLRAMEQVTPLSSRGGRKIAQKPAKPGIKAPDQKQNGKKHLQDLLDGKIEFEISLTDEFLHGNVLGLDPRISRKLQAGQFSPENHLDLHGQNADQAFSSLIHFIRDNYVNSRRCLLIIPGRGRNSPEGRGVLRDQIQIWLTRDPLKRVILAFSTARPRHGGTGALYILLRRYKKSKGKIFWERYT
ncbi:MAG: Smr/MutS family protein [Desulfohalobiaceae bacterium]|nr:Smr/MutS family protein [Desulfohalobiaceae bacterium]